MQPLWPLTMFAEYDDFGEEEENEDEFVPGYDDEEEEDDQDVVGESQRRWEGRLTIDDEKKLHWKGVGFELTSKEPCQVNVLTERFSDAQEMMVDFSGPVEEDGSDHNHSSSSNLKRPPPSIKTFNVKFLSTNENGSGKTASVEGGGNEEQQDEKKSSAFVHGVKIYGAETWDAAPSGCTKIEFMGSFSATGNDSVPLTCLVRRIPTTAASAPKASPVAAAAARPEPVDDDDDDVLVEEEHQVEVSELIALREEAGLSVEEIRKRYSERTRTADTKRSKYEKEEDEDDIGF